MKSTILVVALVFNFTACKTSSSSENESGLSQKPNLPVIPVNSKGEVVDLEAYRKNQEQLKMAFLEWQTSLVDLTDEQIIKIHYVKNMMTTIGCVRAWLLKSEGKLVIANLPPLKDKSKWKKHNEETAGEPEFPVRDLNEKVVDTEGFDFLRKQIKVKMNELSKEPFKTNSKNYQAQLIKARKLMIRGGCVQNWF